MAILFFIPAIALALLIRYIYKSLFHGLSSIPGPFLAKFTDAWRFKVQRSGQAHTVFQTLQKQYGDVIRVGPNTVMVCNMPEVMTRVFGFKEDYAKSDMMKPWQTINNGKIVPGLASVQDKRSHGVIRKPVANIYSNTNVLQFEPLVDDTIRFFLRRLDEEFMSGRNVGKRCDIDNWVQYFAFDVVGEITLTRRFGFLETGGDIDHMLGDLNEEFDYRSVVGTMPWLDKFLRKNPLYLKFASPSNKFIARSRSLIAARLGEEKAPTDHEKIDSKRKDLMTRFLESKKQYPDIVTDGLLAMYTATNFFAGSDTTAIALRAVIYHVLKNPGVLGRLRKEIDEKGDGRFPMSNGTSTSLPYVDAIIHEALRIHPIGSILLERVIPSSGLQLPTGQKLAPGSVVGMTAWTLHFSKQLYGEDAEVFRPERWLQQEGESETEWAERVKRWKHFDFSFSWGPRACLGKYVALMEIYKIVPTMFGLLDMELVDPDKEWKVEGSFFSRQYNMDIRMKWREGVDKNAVIGSA